MPRARNTEYQHWESLAGITAGFCCLIAPVVLIGSALGTFLSQFLLPSFEKNASLRKALGKASAFPVPLLFLHESIFCRLSLLILSLLMLLYHSEYISHAHNTQSEAIILYFVEMIFLIIIIIIIFIQPALQSELFQ